MADAGTQVVTQEVPAQVQQVMQPPPQPQQQGGGLILELPLLVFVLGLTVFCTYLLRLMRPTLRGDFVGGLLAGIPVMLLLLLMSNGNWIVALAYALPAVGIVALVFDVIDRRAVAPVVKPVQKE